MKNNDFHKGITLTALGSFWWGVIGVIYFEYISFVGHIEVVLHRCIWTALFLLITTSFFSKWKIFFATVKNSKILITLFFSGFLIFVNWAVWIYAVANNQIIDASFGYFIMPILSVLLGNLFFKEILNIKRKISIILVLISITFLLFVVLLLISHIKRKIKISREKYLLALPNYLSSSFFETDHVSISLSPHLFRNVVFL